MVRSSCCGGSNGESRETIEANTAATPTAAAAAVMMSTLESSSAPPSAITKRTTTCSIAAGSHLDLTTIAVEQQSDGGIVHSWGNWVLEYESHQDSVSPILRRMKEGRPFLASLFRGHGETVR
jgi:hypothetical protein